MHKNTHVLLVSGSEDIRSVQERVWVLAQLQQSASDLAVADEGTVQLEHSGDDMQHWVRKLKPGLNGGVGEDGVGVFLIIEPRNVARPTRQKDKG